MYLSGVYFRELPSELVSSLETDLIMSKKLEGWLKTNVYFNTWSILTANQIREKIEDHTRIIYPLVRDNMLSFLDDKDNRQVIETYQLKKNHYYVIGNLTNCLLEHEEIPFLTVTLTTRYKR